MRTNSFFQQPGVWLKGNLHCHSTFSDGCLTPEELKDAYLHHGFDFLALSDHDRFTDVQRLSDENFLFLNSLELTAFTKNEKRIHCNLFWAGDSSIADGQSYAVRNHEQSLEVLEKYRAMGAYIMLNHPHWSMLETPDVQSMSNLFDGVEIWNYSTEWLENMGDGLIFWEEMLRQGWKLWNGGGDDNHNRAPVDSVRCDSFGGYVWVKAAERTPQALLDAMKAGHFYTSTGPRIEDFYVEDGVVHVKCSPCKRIYVTGDHRQYHASVGRFLTEFSVPLKGDETLVRAECMDEAGHSAYSNPIYLERGERI